VPGVPPPGSAPALLPVSRRVRYAETFKTDFIIFIGNDIMCLTSHRKIIFNISQLVDTVDSEIKEKMPIYRLMRVLV
jgi:hypothetical protein